MFITTGNRFLFGPVLIFLLFIGGGASAECQSQPNLAISDDQIRSKISMDLLMASKHEMNFLAHVDPNLYDQNVLENAIRRYETCWLPFQATFPHQAMIPPADVSLVWHAHMLAPLAYREDCLAIVGTIVDHHYEDMGPMVHQKRLEQSESGWEKFCAGEPYRHDRSGQKDYRHKSRYDIVAAVKRQRKFADKIVSSLAKLSSDSAYLPAAIHRYHQFLQLIQTYGHLHVGLTPTLDIDLIWHTHQLHPLAYYRDCLALVGHLINHNDSTGADQLANDSFDSNMSECRSDEMPRGEKSNCNEEPNLCPVNSVCVGNNVCQELPRNEGNCNLPNVECPLTTICAKNGNCYRAPPIVQCGNQTCEQGEVCVSRDDADDWICQPTGGQRWKLSDCNEPNEKCPSNYYCLENGLCKKGGDCNDPNTGCPPNTICLKNGLCYQPPLIVQCGNQTCKQGEVCVSSRENADDWICQPTGEQLCGQVECLPGQICLVQPGMSVCVFVGGQPAQCGNQTGGNSTDGGDNHGGQGGGIPRECNSKRDCPSGETCVLKQGEHKCLPEVEGPQGGGETTSQPPKCTQECDEANECNFVDGQMRCCPKGQGCDRGTG